MIFFYTKKSDFIRCKQKSRPETQAWDKIQNKKYQMNSIKASSNNFNTDQHIGDLITQTVNMRDRPSKTSGKFWQILLNGILKPPLEGWENQRTALEESDSKIMMVVPTQGDAVAMRRPSLMARISVWMTDSAIICFLKWRRDVPWSFKKILSISLCPLEPLKY